MKTITQRELRNESGRVLRAVELGNAYTITRRGTPVAKLVPLDSAGPRFTPARKPLDFDVAKLKKASESSSELLEGLRDDR
ncbi:MAG: type II toxin-antitoxin system prevent-host-death family antitoxin [Ancrocorticia sp.]